jgi:tetratricopeptide (TPR) repeat protein
MDHEAFAQSRRGVYIGRDEYIQRLDEHANGDGPPLVVLGEPGSGKSALLANWVAQYRKEHSDILILQHYIGATPYSADWAAMVRRLMGELKRNFDIRQDIPDKPDELRSAFHNWLYMAAANGKLVLVLDGLENIENREVEPNLELLNQLANTTTHLDFRWLPLEIPQNIRLVASCEHINDFAKLGWASIEILPLSQSEAELLISKYLAMYSKTLDSESIRQITESQSFFNPLYLKVLVEEIRQWGDHNTLNHVISDYLKILHLKSPLFSLISRVIERYECEYAPDICPTMVREALSNILVSPNGLYENDLLSLLGKGKEKLPRHYWAPFFYTSRSIFVNRSGRLTFAHEFIGEAVKALFVQWNFKQRQVHNRIASYLQTSMFRKERGIELLYHLITAEEQEILLDTLRNPKYIARYWQNNKIDIITSWNSITAPQRHLNDAYINIPEDSDSFEEIIIPGLELLSHFGCWSLVEELSEKAIMRFKFLKDRASLHRCFGILAHVYKSQGDYNKALKTLEEQYELFAGAQDDSYLCHNIFERAILQDSLGNTVSAVDYFTLHESICRNEGFTDLLTENLGARGNIYIRRRDFNEALEIYAEQESLAAEVGDHENILQSRFNVNRLLGEDLLAWNALNELGEIYSRTGDISKLASTHYQLAELCSNSRKLSSYTLALSTGAKALYNAINNKIGVASCLAILGMVKYRHMRFEEALSYYNKEESIYKELKHKKGIADCLGRKALVYYRLNNAKIAVKLLGRQRARYEYLGNKEGLVICLRNLGMMEICVNLNADYKIIKFINTLLSTLVNFNLHFETECGWGDYRSDMGNLSTEANARIKQLMLLAKNVAASCSSKGLLEQVEIFSNAIGV